MLGGGLTDPPNSAGFGPTGATVDKMNIIRNELNQQGGNFGLRSSYQSIELTPFTPPAYLPFSSSASTSLQGGIVPMNTDKFISYTP